MPAMPTKIKNDVYEVLKRYGREFVTAYQIFEWLPEAIKEELTSKYSKVGAGSGHYYTAITHVTKAAGMLKRKVKQEWLDTRMLSVKCRNKPIRPGNQYCALYRLKK